MHSSNLNELDHDILNVFHENGIIVNKALDEDKYITEIHFAFFGGEPLFCDSENLKLSNTVKNISKDFSKGFSSSIIANGVLTDYIESNA